MQYENGSFCFNYRIQIHASIFIDKYYSLYGCENPFERNLSQYIIWTQSVTRRRQDISTCSVVHVFFFCLNRITRFSSIQYTPHFCIQFSSLDFAPFAKLIIAFRQNSAPSTRQNSIFWTFLHSQSKWRVHHLHKPKSV